MKRMLKKKGFWLLLVLVIAFLCLVFGGDGEPLDDVLFEEEEESEPFAVMPANPVPMTGETISVYLDSRQEQLLATARIPEPLSEEARAYLQFYSFWDCMDVNGDGWGDLQLPYRWEETADGSVCMYHYIWLWKDGTFRLDRNRSNAPAL